MPPRTILHLVARVLALINTTFLVCDADLAVQNLLICLPALEHLSVDTKSLLEQRRDVLDGADCPAIMAKLSDDHISRLMIARLNRISRENLEI